MTGRVALPGDTSQKPMIGEVDVESIHTIAHRFVGEAGSVPLHDSVCGVVDPVMLPVATTVIVVLLKKLPAVNVPLVQSFTGSRAVLNVSAVPVHANNAQRIVGVPLPDAALH